MDRVDYESAVIQDLFNFHKNEELKLDPWYQRRSVWTPAQKGYLINTIFVKKPIPTIYIRHYLDIDKEKSIKEVVDGQQRLRAVLGYLADEFPARHPSYLKPVKYSDLTQKDKNDLKMTKLSTGVLVNASESDVIEIFGRLNTISKTLNTQEKRNAKYSGPFKQFCLENAAKHVKYWRDTNIFSATAISRMDEVQFVSDVTYNFINGLSDFSAPKLDSTYGKYEEAFPNESKLQARIDKVFKILQSVSPETIRDTIFSRSPIFFSLFLVLDEKGKIQEKKFEQTLIDIDSAFNADTAKNKADRDFIDACTASTQRIKSRRTRHDYLKKLIA